MAGSPVPLFPKDEEHTFADLEGSRAQSPSGRDRLGAHREHVRRHRPVVELERDVPTGGSRQEPAQAKAEIAKHLDGELTVRPLPASGRERRAEIRGRAKLNSLLEGQEAVCGEVVAGAGFEPATFGL